ncbi:MAG: hypothetical protein RLY86_2368 [Pseudomonadota bacterium]|jgi:CRISPR-associated protein (TIGR03986 family)
MSDVVAKAIKWFAAEMARRGPLKRDQTAREAEAKMDNGDFGHAEEEDFEELAKRVKAFSGDELAAMKREAPPPAPPPPPFRGGPGRGEARGPAGRKPSATRPERPEGLLSSPFRFVALNDTVVMAEPAVRDMRLDTPIKGGFSGRIEVTLAVETPLLIGEEQAQEGTAGPLRLGPGGGYAIPGATLRGMLRAGMEIVAGGRLSQVNGHHRYGLRDFTHPLIRPMENGREGKSLLAPDLVKAGWLSRVVDVKDKSKETYRITPCADWHVIHHNNLRLMLDRRAQPESAPYEWRAEWLKTDLPSRYRQSGATVRGKTIDFTTLPQLGFRIDKSGTGKSRAKPGDGGVRGMLVFSNKSPAAPDAKLIEEKEQKGGQGQPKKREYVFETAPDAVPFDIPAEAWDRFHLINTKPARRNRKPDGSWAVLSPSLELENGRVPVFYVGDPANGAEFQFGLTRFFKVAHRYSVRDLLDRVSAHKRPALREISLKDNTYQPDFVEALFGYVHEVEDLLADPDAAPKHVTPAGLARRGRVAVGFATLQPGSNAVETPVMETVMGAPRASFAPFYLAGRIKDYSDPQATLAGRKRYLPRYPDPRHAADGLRQDLRQQIDRLGKTGEDLKEVLSRLSFLVPAKGNRELLFKATLRLHNVTAAEVGGLLWVLTHGGDPAKPHRHLLGRGKPFGAGQTRVKAIALNLKELDAEAEALLTAPSPDELPGDGREGWVTDVTAGQSLKPFLAAFETYMAAHWKGWPIVPPVQEFLAASDPTAGAALAAPADRATAGTMGPAGKLAYPILKNFKDIQKPSKADIQMPDPRDPPGDRYLPPPGSRRG